MRMVKFEPSQNPNPLTDYDKTLYNWLGPRDVHVTQNLCQSAVRERLAKYVKYKASLFILIFPGLAYWSNPCMEFYAWWFKTCVVTQGSAFWGSTRCPTTFGVQIPQKPSKMAFYKHVRASANGFKTNDVIEDWRHWLAVDRGQAAYTIYSVLEITADVYFSNYDLWSFNYPSFTTIKSQH